MNIFVHAPMDWGIGNLAKELVDSLIIDFGSFNDSPFFLFQVLASTMCSVRFVFILFYLLVGISLLLLLIGRVKLFSSPPLRIGLSILLYLGLIYVVISGSVSLGNDFGLWGRSDPCHPSQTQETQEDPHNTQ